MSDSTTLEVLSTIYSGQESNTSSKGSTSIARPSESSLLQITDDIADILSSEQSLLEIEGPVTVVGDLHGNLVDLFRILEKCGYPPQTKYLFLGDYVDRGDHSLEVITTLFCLKLLFPKCIYLLRGNHECESISAFYGFKREVLKHYDSKVYYAFIEAFQYLPFGAVINGSVFCVHGGIGPNTTLSKVAALQRPMISADKKLASDLVWSDPSSQFEGFEVSDRGSGALFGSEALMEFLELNNLTKVIRSHEVADNGFCEIIKNCITIFSNTDYCGTGNAGAVAVLDEEGSEFTYKFFRPLSKSEISKRRVLIPEFVLQWMSSDEMKFPLSSPPEPFDLIFSCIENA